MYIIKGNNLDIDIKNINSSNIVVLIYLGRVPEMLEAIMFLYINKITFITIDPTEPIERTKYKVNDLKKGGKSIYVLTSRTSKEIFEGNYIITIEDINSINRLGDCFKSTYSETKNEIAYILYTSGSTGVPKGVEITYKGLNNFIKSISDLLNFTAGKKILCSTTISFDIFFLESIAALIKNLTVILLDEREQRNPRLISEIVADNKVDIVQMTPSGMQMIVNYDKHVQCLSDVKKILIGGEIFPPQLLRILQKNTKARIYNMYGPTETTIWSTVSELTNKDTIDIGKPIKNTRIYILDEHLDFVSDGDAGEICIAGDGLAKGYFNNVNLTNEKFIYKNERMYRTGDYGRYLEDGNIEYIGRIDNQVKIRGHRIELEEIEKVLMQYDTITQAVVVYGNNSRKDSLVAFYISNNKITFKNCIQYLSKKLPEYMIPTEFIKVKKFFYTTNGKLDRKMIWNKYIKKIHNKKELYGKCASTENLIAEIIEKTIEKNSTYQLNGDLSFVELGVDSIDFMSIVVELEKEFNIEFEPDKLLLTEFDKLKDLVSYVQKKIEEKKIEDDM